MPFAGGGTRIHRCVFWLAGTHLALGKRTPGGVSESLSVASRQCSRMEFRFPDLGCPTHQPSQTNARRVIFLIWGACESQPTSILFLSGHAPVFLRRAQTKEKPRSAKAERGWKSAYVAGGSSDVIKTDYHDSTTTRPLNGAGTAYR